MLDVHALDRADPLGEGEDLRFAERLGGEPPAIPLVDHGRVQALLDRRPDRERRREVVALDDQVGPVAHPDLLDAREQVIGGVPGRHIGEPRLDTHADEGHEPPVLPGRRLGELGVAETSTDLGVGLGRMGDRGVHRHVDVVASSGERGVEDRRVEPRVAGVQDDIGADLAGEVGDGSGV